MTTNLTIPRFDYDIEPIFTSDDMSNKLFCTFSTEDQLEEVLTSIQGRYKIIYNSFILPLPSKS